MKEMVRYGFILALICFVAAGLLAGVNSLTKAKIIAQAQSEEETSLKEVIPEGEHFEAVKKDDTVLYYKAHDKDAKLVGIAFKATGKGYSSDIETMVGMAPEGKILAIKVISHNETPGLGSRVAEDTFTGQFADKNIDNLASIQAVTGATISSKAVIDAVTKKAEEIKALIDNESR
ncbi:MAG: RnfABCDGE type electron transport complex subunit G [Candidatus Omnitrophica bacterium]|nr:RnfABCDGE type electron transport complex subunit G [Candidatus Omnitrophota bacterium]